MLTAIEIENFKAFGDRQRIELRPLTLLFGPNSGGKSSLIHVLHYAREIMLGRGRDVHQTESGADMVNLGGLHRLVHGRKLDGRMITLRFEMDLENMAMEGAPGKEPLEIAEEMAARVTTAAVTLRIPARFRDGVVAVETYEVELNGVPFALFHTIAGSPHSELKELNLYHPICVSEPQRDEGIDLLRDHIRKLQEMAGEFDEVGAEDIPIDEYSELIEMWLNPLEYTHNICQTIEPEVDIRDTRRVLTLLSVREHHLKTTCDWALHDLKETLKEEEDDEYNAVKILDVMQGELFEIHNTWTQIRPEEGEFSRGGGEMTWSQMVVDRLPNWDQFLETTQNAQLIDGTSYDAKGAYIDRLPGGMPDWDKLLETHLQADLFAGSGYEAEDSMDLFIDLLAIGPGRMLRDFLKGFRYLGPLRQIPPRTIPPSDPVGYSKWPCGLAAWERLAMQPKDDLLDRVSNWLWKEQLLDTGFRLKVRHTRQLDETTLHSMLADQDFSDSNRGSELDQFPGISETPRGIQVVLEDMSRQGIEVHPYDVGVGLSQVIPAIVAALDFTAPIVAMEQPELHLHPKQQAALGDLMIEGALSGSGRNLIIETHSEHLILRLLRRIRETEKAGDAPGEHPLHPKDLRVYHISQKETTGSVIQQMIVDDKGEFIESWPDDFFDQDYKERYSR